MGRNMTVKVSDDNIFGEVTAFLERDDETIQHLLQILYEYEVELDLLRQETREILTAYGLDLQAPVNVRHHLEKILNAG
jgi:hypothetical protein